MIPSLLQVGDLVIVNEVMPARIVEIAVKNGVALVGLCLASGYRTDLIPASYVRLFPKTALPPVFRELLSPTPRGRAWRESDA
jgi:hypothetical protein